MEIISSLWDSYYEKAMHKNANFTLNHIKPNYN